MSIYAYAIKGLEANHNHKKNSYRIKDHKVKEIRYKNIALIGEFVEDENRKIGLKNIFFHEEIVEKIWEDNPTLPVRFGTILEDESEAKSILADFYYKLIEKINKLTGKVELGIKIFKEKNCKELMTNHQLDLNKKQKGANSVKAYISRLKRKYDHQNNQENIIKNSTDKIDKCLSHVASQGKYTTLRTDTLIFDGSYLVCKENISLFKEKVQKIDNRFSDFQLFLSGPWPPYSFCKLDFNSCHKGGQSWNY